MLGCRTLAFQHEGGAMTQVSAEATGKHNRSDWVRRARGRLDRAPQTVSRLDQRIRQLMWAVAAGIGLVLGGGVASRTASVLMRVGARLALARVARSVWKSSESGNGSPSNQPQTAA